MEDFMAKAAQRVGNPDVATPAISSAILKVAPWPARSVR
jgi:hypothetical protein